MTEMLTIVPAGAGSGKTFRIKSNLTDWVKKNLVAPDRILAVTFTEAAAAELRGRIRSSLLNEGMVEQALGVEQAYVSTIHGLGLRILSEHAFAAGASPQPRALAEAERDLLIRQAMAQSAALDTVKLDLARFGYRPNFQKNMSMEDSFRERLLETIDLLRGLGDSGTDMKLADSAIARLRNLYGSVVADSAPLEARLLSAIQVLLEAYPNGLAAQATSAQARKDFANNLSAMRRALQSGELQRNWGLWKKLTELRQSKRGAPTPEGYDKLADEVIAAASDIVRHPGPLEDACAHLTALIRGAQEVMAKYAHIKREAGVIDYADMICDAERLLRERPDVLQALVAEIDCVIIDEFQDTNPVQFALLWRIAQSAKSVLIVGDTKQAIMGFQGADARLSEALERQRPDACSPLTSNWRSDPRLMEMVNAISGGLFGDDYVPLSPERPETGTTFAEILRVSEGRRSKKSRPEEHVAVRIADIITEAGPIVDRDSDPKSPEFRPVEPRDIAVLAPTHAMAERYADALKKQGVPVRISSPGWMDAPAVLAARNAMAFAVDPSDLHAALVFLTLGPSAMPLQDALRMLAKETLTTCDNLQGLQELSTTASEMPLEMLLSEVLKVAGISRWAERLPEAAQAHADLMRLHAEVSEFVSAHRDFKAAAGFYGASAQVFLGWLEARRSEDGFDRHPDPGQSDVQGVEIVTWHSSKGREWPMTVVVGLDKKIGARAGKLTAEFTDFSDLGRILEKAFLLWTPVVAIKEKQDIFIEDQRSAAEADARRMLYVLLTRARDRLILEWPDFALKKLGESNGPANCTEMLVLDGKMDPQAGALLVGDRSFPARTLICSAEAPELVQSSTKARLSTRALFGEFRSGATENQTPWRIRPSAMTAEPERHVETRIIKLDVVNHAAQVSLSASERGTALHKAMRVLLLRPELRPRLGAATGFDDTTLEVLRAQADALCLWLKAEGYPDINCEVPIQTRARSGAEFNGVIDLIAKGDGKCLIIDHKSGGGDFSQYYSQLQLYRDYVSQYWCSENLPGLAIHWIDRAEIELLLE